jgi:hypothetical protein
MFYAKKFLIYFNCNQRFIYNLKRAFFSLVVVLGYEQKSQTAWAYQAYQNKQPCQKSSKDGDGSTLAACRTGYGGVHLYKRICRRNEFGGPNAKIFAVHKARLD